MTFLGFITFTELEYPDSKETIQSCLDAGLKIITITDKDRNAALDIAKDLAIVQDKHGVVTQEDLDGFSDEQYESIVNRLLVYCRPSRCTETKSSATSKTPWPFGRILGKITARLTGNANG